jgi:hypothetical protein
MIYVLLLSHAPNPDIPGGYWDGKPQCRGMTIEVDSLEDASSACLQYIAKHNLGSGNWTGGSVFDRMGYKVAEVSYNGRVWDNCGKELLAELRLSSPHRRSAPQNGSGCRA